MIRNKRAIFLSTLGSIICLIRGNIFRITILTSIEEIIDKKYRLLDED